VTTRRSLLLVGVASLLATGCPPPNVSIPKPRANALADDPTVAIEVLVPRRFTAEASTVTLDGVDLVAALGLVPPFADAAGNVVIGGQPVAISDFDYEIPASGPVVIRATLSGLAVDDHVLDAQAQPVVSGSFRSRIFAVVEPMTLEAEVIASSGTPAPPLVIGNHVGNATLGESLAGPPVGRAGGGSLRSGYVPAAQARAGAP
jgi:hypothetical protein